MKETGLFKQHMWNVRVAAVAYVVKAAPKLNGSHAYWRITVDLANAANSALKSWGIYSHGGNLHYLQQLPRLRSLVLHLHAPGVFP